MERKQEGKKTPAKSLMEKRGAKAAKKEQKRRIQPMQLTDLRGACSSTAR